MPASAKYNAAMGARLLDLIERGQGLKTACDTLKIARRNVRDWAVNTPEFGRALQLARRQSYETWADQILEIAAEAAKPGKTMAEVQAARLEIDSRKWLLSKLHPEQYGDRVEVTGADGKDLFPASPESAIPRLLTVLSVLLPTSSNSELFTLAEAMARKLRPNGEDHTAPQLERPKGNGEEPAD